MNRILISVGVIFLFILSTITPVVNSNNFNESDEIQIKLNCYRYNEYPSSDYHDYTKSINKNIINSADINPSFDFSENVCDGPMDSAWSMQSHDTHHTGRSPYETGDNPDGLEKWRFYFTGWLDDTPVIDRNGTIYCKGAYDYLDRYIFSIYPNGTEKWKFKVGGLILGSSPAIAEDGTIYIGSWDDYLYAINPDGTLKWRFNAGGTIASSPAIAEDGTIYFGNFDKGVYAINPDGTEKWFYDTGGDVLSDPAIGDDGTIYVGCWDNYLYALYPNGTLRWRFQTGHYIKGPASIAADGTIYVGSWDDYLYAIFPNNGTMKWRYRVAYGTETNPSIASDGTIYVGGWERLWAIYPNGTLRWEFDLGSDRHIHMSSPAISADGIIYVGTNIGETAGGEIIAVNPDGTERWRKRIAYEWVDSSPSIGEDGTVYIGSAYEMGKGYLHAFGSVEDNTPPDTPTIDGPTEGKAGVEYDYFISSIDPENNPVSFYIDWGDDTTSEWNREYASGETAIISHIWDDGGDYTIGVKSRDTLGEESDWAYLKVTVPVNEQSTHPWFYWFFERFPNAFPIFRSLIGLK